jgi:hypothetical protein
MLRILQGLETNDFDGITTGDESWFQHTTAYSKMFARSAADIIPRTQQGVGVKTMITVFLTAKKLIMFNVLPRDSTFTRLYFIHNIFLDLKRTNLNFRRQKTWSTFWVPWIIPCARADRRSRQKLGRITFAECRARPIHQR